MAGAETERERQRRLERREKRVLFAVVGVLLLVTVLVSPLAFGQLWLLLLLIVPFVLMVLTVALIPPLVRSRDLERADREEAAALRESRRREAERHAVVAPRKPASLADDFEALQEAMARAEAEHGIHFGCAALRDGEFLQAFHANDLKPAQFRHGDHLRYTFLMLRRVPAGLVAETIAGNLRSFLRVVCGSEALFHATQTHAWVALLQAMPERTFSAALRTHAEGMRKEEMKRYYSPELLATDAARSRVVPPDRERLPGLARKVPPAPAAQAPMASST